MNDGQEVSRGSGISSRKQRKQGYQSAQREETNLFDNKNPKFVAVHLFSTPLQKLGFHSQYLIQKIRVFRIKNIFYNYIREKKSGLNSILIKETTFP